MQIDVSSLKYADDAGLLDENADESSERISVISVGSKRDASMVISVAKTKAMHIHKKVRVSATTESEIEALLLKHKCAGCGRDFPTAKGLAIHRTRGGTEVALCAREKGHSLLKQYRKRRRANSTTSC